MCALAHYLERRGIAAVVIGLVPQHVEHIRPPRALVVPFELGRPFGAPGAPELQRRVLDSALKLLDRSGPGPAIERFHEDAPAAPGAEEDESWSCPVSFAPPTSREPASLGEAVRDEIARLRPWWAQAARERGRTAVATSRLEPEAVADFLAELAAEGDAASPVEGLALGDALKLAAEDLKAFYLEAATARPGASTGELHDWLWEETAAGRLLRTLREVLAEHPDGAVALFARFTLVPDER